MMAQKTPTEKGLRHGGSYVVICIGGFGCNCCLKPEWKV